MNTYTTRKGKTVQSPYSHDEAARRLKLLVECGELTSDFPVDLASGVRLSDDGSRVEQLKLSYDQLVWVHVLVLEQEANDEQLDVETSHDDLSAVRVYLQTARDNGLQFPKLRLRSSNGLDVVASLAGDRSRTPGRVWLTSKGAWHNRTLYGSIHETTGRIRWSTSSQSFETSDVLAVVKSFVADPAGTAKAQGAITSSCCFCGQRLATKESVGAGYGPVCADKWNLPWGADTASDYDTMKSAVITAAEDSVSQQF